MAVPNDIIVFHYPASPYARRILWYFTLRGLPYAQCIQPLVMPRPDMEALGIAYRRIPLVSIGRDVYADTRLILRKLEAHYPQGSLGASDPEQKLIESLLTRWLIDGEMFRKAAELLPLNLPVLNDQRFLKDRSEFFGRTWDRETIAKARAENVLALRDAFFQMETTLLADGRDWALKSEKPTLADIEGIWMFHWLMGMEGALPPESISEKQFPRVFAWVRRFQAALKACRESAPRPVSIQGGDAVEHVLRADFADDADRVDESDPLGLMKGMEVEVWPVDSGAAHRDRGTLIALSSEEAVIEVKSKVSAKVVRLHTPRRGFAIARVRDGKL